MVPVVMVLDAMDATVSADPDPPPDTVAASELTGMLTVSWFATAVSPASGVLGPRASLRFAVACTQKPEAEHASCASIVFDSNSQNPRDVPQRGPGICIAAHDTCLLVASPRVSRFAEPGTSEANRASRTFITTHPLE